MGFSNWRGKLAVAPVVLAAGVAFAQGDVDLRKASTLSPSETVSQSHDFMQKINNTKNRIGTLAEKARRQRDVIRVNCVNDKALQVKGHVAVAEQSMSAIDTAVSRSDDGARQHEFTRLTILYQKVLVLGTEAESCVGEDVSYIGDTKVQVDIDPSIPVADPTEPSLPLPDVTRPVEATPFA